MPNASSNRTDIKMVQETVLGTTPATPAFDSIRYTGESLNYNISNVTSKEIRSDRMTADSVATGGDATGGLNIEFSAISFDKLIEAAMASSWVLDSPVLGEDTLKNGLTLKSFTTQKVFNDTDVVTFQNFPGTCVNTMNLNIEQKSIVTGSFDLKALDSSMTVTQFVGATTNAAATTSVMNTVSGITSIIENGVASTNKFKSMTLAISNNIRAQDAIGTFGHIGLVLGKIDITGNISIYFKSKVLYDRYHNSESFSIGFTMADEDGNSYDVLIPKAKFESGKIVASGTDTDVMFEGTWRALYDVTENTMIKITRTLV